MHPTVARELATAHVEDLQRTAARSRAGRLARGVVEEPRVKGPSIAKHRTASALLRQFRAPRPRV